MKIEVQLKDPDGLHDAIHDAVKDSLASSGLSLHDDDKELEALEEIRTGRAHKALKKWVEHGEYVTIEFDTKAMTATVKERK